MTGARIFVSYKHRIEPDEPLCKRLHAALERAGHDVFVDTELRIGVEWAAELERQIKASDFCVVLLSEAAVQSEMIAVEVRCAHRAQEKTGKARLLPVRVNYDDDLPYQLNAYLEPLQYAEWRSEADDPRLVQQLLEAIRGTAPSPATGESPGPVLGMTQPIGGPSSAPGITQPIGKPGPAPGRARQLEMPAPYADPRFVATLREPGGAVSVRSEFYVERVEDDDLRRELSKPYGTTSTIRAPRQSGKTSLLFRGIAQARAQGCSVVYCDLQLVGDRDLESADAFLRYLGTMFASSLQLDSAAVDAIWQSSLGTPNKLTQLVEDLVLEKGEPVVLALDEADRLLRTDYHDSVFGLIRAWHNMRALDPRWDNLDILMVIATEPHLLIQNVGQSPFNVGLKLRLQDFNEAQVRELNKGFRSPLARRSVPAMVGLLGGHPYLTHKALYLMVAEGKSWNELARAAPTEGGPFGDHLRRYLWMLRDEEKLREALKRLLRTGRGLDQTSYYRLLRAGLLKGASADSCTFRCQLYKLYLKDRL
jgi:uncharacterized protein with PIN domain